MAQLYEYSWNPFAHPDEVLVKESLFGVLTRPDCCQIDGTQAYRAGTPEWDAFLAATKQRVNSNGHLDPGQKEDEIVRIASSGGALKSRPSFEAFNYVVFVGQNADEVKKRFVADKDYDAVAEIAVAPKQVHLFRLFDGAGETTRHWCPNKRFAGYKQHFLYDGTIIDSIKEFSANGYGLIVWNMPWRPTLLNDGNVLRSEPGANSEQTSLDAVLCELEKRRERIAASSAR